MKILSIDLGARRIGLAVADGTLLATLDTIESENRDDTLQKIMKICREENIEKIVLGLPKSQSGEAEDMVRSFAMELTKTVSLPIEFVDETLTSKEAERLLKDSKLDPRSQEYKKEIDRLSARLILEQYLNEK